MSNSKQNCDNNKNHIQPIIASQTSDKECEKGSLNEKDHFNTHSPPNTTMQVKPQVRTGNLQSALNNYKAEESESAFVIEEQSASNGRERLLTFGSLADMNGRDRSLTFGSELEFSFSNNDNMNSLLVSELNSSEEFNGNDGYKNESVNQVSLDSPLNSHTAPVKNPSVAATKTAQVKVTTGLSIHEILNKANGGVGSGGSDNVFLDGMFINASNGVVAHTPPSAFGTSYEAQHFGKRMRAGSVSGRLRSASDLEDMGIIDRQQKSIIKDLIISGDKELLNALDNYESGDTSQLEALVKNGSLLQNKATDIDLLDDLDLDFLTFNDGSVTNSNGVGNSTMEDSKASTNNRLKSQQRTIDGNGTESGMAVPNSYEDDGIGELDFNDDYGGVDYLDVLANSGTSNNISVTSGRTTISEPRNIQTPLSQSQMQPSGQQNSNSSLSTLDAQQRCRSNTFSSLLGGTPPAEDIQQNTFGRWIDNPVSLGSLEGLTDKYLMESDNLSLNEELRNIIVTPDINVDNEGLDDNANADKKRNKLKNSSKSSPSKDKKKSEKKTYTKKDKKSSKKEEKNKSKDSQNVSEAKPIVHGLGRPRSMSDPNLVTSTDADGLLQVDRPEGWVGAYSPESRKIRIERFMKKRNHRVWTKKVKYDVRKNFADSRLRVKGRFVKKEDELLMRDLLSLT